jgi:hypothetical protein
VSVPPPLLVPAPPRVVRALIAQGVLGPEDSAPRLGAITLRPHQQAAVSRLSAVLDAHGGALLADDVGLGKTYVAAAIARRYAHVLIVAPAVLRSMWCRALDAATVRATVTSYTVLSRGPGPPGPFDLLVLDEAHHARSPHTRRYAHLAALAARARVLLVSATPIHNSRRDLAALLALFLGERAWTLDDDALARYVVRREHADVPHVHLPALVEPQRIVVGDDEALLEALLELPPPVPPSDGGDGGALLVWGLVRQWASSHGALTAALRRRLARAAALEAALADGMHLSRAELAAWVCSDHAVQLAFPELLTSPHPSPNALRRAVAAHAAAVRTLLRRIRHGEAMDALRAERLRELRAAHPGEKIVAFTQFADTVHALYRHLRTEPGVAALGARGAVVAGGRLARRDAIARFAPHAAGVAAPHPAQRIDLLLTTDLLSEGVNLHDASVVVHLDLPWTPARLEQRIGRARRLGALHTRLAAYALAPPAAAEALLRVEQRLRDKLGLARRTLGMGALAWPTATGEPPRDPEATPSPVRLRELLVQELARWRFAAPTPDPPGTPVVTAVRAPHPGALALFHEGATARLAAALGESELDDAPATLLHAVRLAGGEPAPVSEHRLWHASALVERWIARRATLQAIGEPIPPHARHRRLVLERIAAILARAPHHDRPLLAAAADRARDAAIAPLGAGAERALADLATAPIPDRDWLQAVAAFADAHRRPAPRAPSAAIALVALILLEPPQ